MDIEMDLSTQYLFVYGNVPDEVVPEFLDAFWYFPLEDTACPSFLIDLTVVAFANAVERDGAWCGYLLIYCFLNFG